MKGKNQFQPWVLVFALLGEQEEYRSILGPHMLLTQVTSLSEAETVFAEIRDVLDVIVVTDHSEAERFIKRAEGFRGPVIGVSGDSEVCEHLRSIGCTKTVGGVSALKEVLNSQEP